MRQGDGRRRLNQKEITNVLSGQASKSEEGWKKAGGAVIVRKYGAEGFLQREEQREGMKRGSVSEATSACPKSLSRTPVLSPRMD